MDQAGKDSVEKIKSLLQEKVELYQPEFNKPFELTTDASNFAVGAVLSQNRHPITFIYRTLSKTEQNYATNEKELLAIVWALQTLRNYLYGIADLTIYTDHQSLIYSISEKNPNSKLKRWKNLIAEYNAKILYKPGHQNIVADALSRQQINMNSSLSSSIHSRESSPVEIIRKVPNAINNFRNQIHIKQGNNNNILSNTPFPLYTSHEIEFSNQDDLMSKMKHAVVHDKINAIYTSEEVMFNIKNRIVEIFPQTKFVYTTKINENITDKNRQLELIKTVHNRAHRNDRNNVLELSESYFWPEMKKDCLNYARTCMTCHSEKYERHPKMEVIRPTPIPVRSGTHIQMDIFHLQNKLYISTIDRYSKYCYVRNIPDKRNISEYIEEILRQIYPQCQTLMTDNENILYSNSSIAVYNSTLLEIARSLAKDKNTDVEDQIFNAVTAYNETIHSVIKQKPVQVFFNQEKFPKIHDLLKQNQEYLLQYHNKKRIHKFFLPGDTIYVKNDRRRKDTSRYVKHTVKEDREDTILTTKGKIIHKDRVRNAKGRFFGSCFFQQS